MTTQSSIDPSTSESAKEAASTAQDEARNVAGSAKEQGAHVASEAADATRNVARDVFGNVTDAAREHGMTQRDNIVSTLSSLGDDLSSMADQAPAGLAGDLTRQAAEQARSLTSRLEDRDPGDILDDVRRFARERPGLFLLGALGAGVVAGRLLAGTRDGVAAAAANDVTSASAPSSPTATTQPTEPTYGEDPVTSTSTFGRPTPEPELFDRSAPLGDGPIAEPLR